MTSQVRKEEVSVVSGRGSDRPEGYGAGGTLRPGVPTHGLAFPIVSSQGPSIGECLVPRPLCRSLGVAASKQRPMSPLLFSAPSPPFAFSFPLPFPLFLHPLSFPPSPSVICSHTGLSFPIWAMLGFLPQSCEVRLRA